MAVWLIREGKHGEEQAFALEDGVAVVDWRDIGDLARISTRTDLEGLLRWTYLDARQGTIWNYLGQLWAFRERIQADDLVAMPLKGQAAIRRPRYRPAQVRTGLPARCASRTAGNLDQVRHPAQRVRSVPALFPRGHSDGLPNIPTQCGGMHSRHCRRKTPAPVVLTADLDVPEAEVASLDLEQYGLDQIRQFIGHKYAGLDLARLVYAPLKAQRYFTALSPAGPDGGVDIIAGQDALGFDPPGLCVKVKSADQLLNINPLRELQWVLKNFGAEQGLLVSWGGFNQNVLSEARRLYFGIRLWDSGDVINALLDNYERLPEEMRAELPLKRIWTLVPEEQT
jgi:restriction system protein